jgi:hypothetical protein
LDYWSSTSINKCSYTDRGLVSTVDIDTSGSYEDFAPFGGVIQPIRGPRQPERPVVVVDRGGFVDPIAPTEQVLDRKQCEL